MIRAIIAYILLVAGLTNTIGLLIGSLLTVPLSWLIPHALRLRVIHVLGVFSGFGAMLAAFTLFWLLGVSFSIAIPIIIAVWTTFYYFSFHQSLVEWLFFEIGILVAWVTLRGVFGP